MREDSLRDDRFEVSVTFDEHRCAKGLEALRAYKAEWDEDARVYRKNS